jgi:membrane protein YqaA with SNARE-associated domain
LARLTHFIQTYALGLGGFGLGLIAFLDSSFIPLPGAVDGGLLYLVTQNPDRWLYYAATTLAGSMAGCYALYFVARKGGEAFLRKRFHERHVESGIETFRRYGLLAIVVPSILPPPAPFKIFVLLAGMTEVPTGAFLLATAIGRGFRYGGEAWLARRYGADAGRFVTQNLTRVSIWLAAAVAVGGLLYVLWRRRRAA